MIRFGNIFVLGSLLVIYSCEDEPANPYDNLNYNTDTTTTQTADPTSIVGLHRNVFFPKCAKSGCHDGTFEPDYRTVMSTYSTLVYQPVIKTTVDSISFFRLRVIPYNADSSLLMERLLTQTSDYMPSNGNRLSAAEINNIRTWINNGARDQEGNVAQAPNLPPVITAIGAIDQSSLQPLTARLGGIGYNPIIVAPGQNIYIVVDATDDSTAKSDYTVNQLKLSYDQDDFSAATTVSGIYIPVPPVWVVPLSANDFTPNDTVFFRYYVGDGDHPSPTEFPRDDYPFYYKFYCSFIVQ